MRISDWSSDVCSSDLQRRLGPARQAGHHDLEVPAERRLPARPGGRARPHRRGNRRRGDSSRAPRAAGEGRLQDRKSVGEGKSVSVRVDVGGGRIIKTKTKRNTATTYIN